MKNYWILLAAFGIAGCQFVPGEIVEESQRGIFREEGSPDRPSQPPMREEPTPAACEDGVYQCHDELARQCGMREWGRECDDLTLRCKELEATCGGMQPLPPPCDDAAIAVCYDKYKELCASRPEEPQCVEELKYCESLRVDCSSQPPPPPPTQCDSMVVEACYARYKDACAAQPETEDCQAVLKDCDAARASC